MYHILCQSFIKLIPPFQNVICTSYKLCKAEQQVWCFTTVTKQRTTKFWHSIVTVLQIDTLSSRASPVSQLQKTTDGAVSSFPSRLSMLRSRYVHPQVLWACTAQVWRQDASEIFSCPILLATCCRFEQLITTCVIWMQTACHRLNSWATGAHIQLWNAPACSSRIADSSQFDLNWTGCRWQKAGWVKYVRALRMAVRARELCTASCEGRTAQSRYKRQGFWRHLNCRRKTARAELSMSRNTATPLSVAIQNHPNPRPSPSQTQLPDNSRTFSLRRYRSFS